MNTASLILQINSDGYLKAQERLRALADQGKSVEVQAGKLAKSAEDSAEREYQAYLKLEARKAGLRDKEAAKTQADFQKRQDAYQKQWMAAEAAADKAAKAADRELETLRRQLYTEEEWIRHSAEKRRQIIMSNALLTEAERSKLLAANASQGSNRLRDMLPGAGAAAGSHLEGMATAAVYAGGALVTGLAVHGVAQATKEYEGLLTVLEGATGSAERAERAFDALEATQAADLFGENQMVDAFVKLRDVGLNPSARALQAYSDLAAAKGKTVTDVTDAIAGAALGSGRVLKALQIGMKADGDQIEMTFRGMKTTIQNSSQAIEQYMISLAENNFGGAVSRKMETLAGSTAALKDAWGDFAREIGKSGVAQALIDITRAATAAVKAVGELTGGSDKTPKRELAPDEYWDLGVKRKYSAEQMKQFQDEIATNLTGFYQAKAEQEKQAADDSNSALGISEKERRDILAGSYDEQLSDLRKHLRTKAEIAEDEFQKQRAIIMKNPNAGEAETMMRAAEAERSAATHTVRTRKNGYEPDVTTPEAGYDRYNAMVREQDMRAAEQREQEREREIDQVKSALTKQVDAEKASYQQRMLILEGYSGEDAQRLWDANEAGFRKHLDKLAATEHEKQVERERKRAELLNTDDSELAQIQYREAQKFAALSTAHDEQLISEAEFQQAKAALAKKAALEQRLFMDQQAELSLTSASHTFGSLGSIAKKYAGEQSSAYRTMFAIQKAFTVASATVSIAGALSKAADTPWPANIAAYLDVMAKGAQIVAMIAGAEYSGAYDSGGYIPAGGVGLVGERGPELVRGPASVTGREDTSRMMGGGRQPVIVQNLIDVRDIARGFRGLPEFHDAVKSVIQSERNTIRAMARS